MPGWEGRGAGGGKSKQDGKKGTGGTERPKMEGWEYTGEGLGSGNMRDRKWEYAGVGVGVRGWEAGI